MRTLPFLLSGFVGICAIAGAQAPALELPYHESFSGSALSPGWQVHLSGINVAKVADGRLEISARENTYAHVARKLGVDFVRASCAIRPGTGISWCTSLVLYWGPGDWVQIGMIPSEGGRFYVCEMVEENRFEHNLGPCDLQAWSHVAIELGQDCIRFRSSPDGVAWRTERCAARLPRFDGPPQLLIVGKGHGSGAGAYPKPHLDNDYEPDAGQLATSLVRDVRVTSVEATRLRASPDEVKAWEEEERDTLGDAVLAAGCDPTYDAVAALVPPMKWPREITGVPEHPHDVGVAADGTIELSDDPTAGDAPRAFFEVGEPPVRLGAGAPPEKRLLDGRRPLIVAAYVHDGLGYEATIVGHSEGMKPETPLSALVRLAISNPGATERAVRVAFRVAGGKEAAPPVRWSFALPAGGAKAFFVRAPFGGGAPVEIEAAAFSSALAEAMACWDRRLGAGMQVEVPEARVSEGWRTWLAYGLLNVDKRGEVYEPHDGAGFYEMVYGYSAALWCHALDLWGFHQDSRRYLESLLTFQAADGLFAVNFGLPDMGALLFALCQHYRLTGDAAWLATVADRMVRMGRWYVEHRTASMIPAEGPRGVTWGLIKYQPYCDQPSPGFSYLSDAYAVLGLEETAAAFAEISRDEDAAWIAKEAAAYRRDVLQSMDAAVLERGGLKILPMEPDTRRILKSTGYRACDYYSLVAGMLLETGFLAPGTPRARWLTDFLERRGGLLLGMSRFAGGVDHAYTYGYWMDALARDEIRRVLTGFYGLLAGGMSRTTYCGVEVTALKTGANTPTTPHTYSSTQQLRLLRMMLLREEGGTLRIGEAIPNGWLAAGRRIEVRGAPTLFGPVSFVIAAAAAGDRITVRLDPPGRKKPEAIRIRLRQPEARPIREVKVGGQPWTAFEGDTVRLPAPDRAITIDVIYKP